MDFSGRPASCSRWSEPWGSASPSSVDSFHRQGRATQPAPFDPTQGVFNRSDWCSTPDSPQRARSCLGACIAAPHTPRLEGGTAMLGVSSVMGTFDCEREKKQTTRKTVHVPALLRLKQQRKQNSKLSSGDMHHRSDDLRQCWLRSNWSTPLCQSHRAIPNLGELAVTTPIWTSSLCSKAGLVHSLRRIRKISIHSQQDETPLP